MPEWKREIKQRVAGVDLTQSRGAEIIEELAQDLQQHYEELLAGGASKDEAYRTALAELSDHELLVGELRRIERAARQEPLILGSRRKDMIGGLWQDLRYGARILRKNPGFTLVAVLSLALGIGANTAIFQLLNAVRLRTLPVKNPQEIAEVRLSNANGMRGSFSSAYPPLSNPIWEQIRDRQQSFSGIFAWSNDSFNLAQGGEVRFAKGLWVSGDFFNVLGVRPLLGRVFTSADDRRGCGSPGAVISYSFWQREFGGDAGVIGRKLMLSNRPLEIIGVTPANFFGLEIGRSFDVAVPVCGDAYLRGANSRLDVGTSWWLTVMGRLKPGWSLQQATAHLGSISSGIFETTLPKNYPARNIKDYLGFKLMALPAGTGLSEIRENYSSSLWVLLALAGLVLLIACANLANLMLARASVREQEIAVRLALGASRSRLVRQLLAESLLLAAFGAAFGALLAGVLSRSLISFISTEGSPLFVDLAPDLSMLGFTTGLAVLTCLFFGLTPALRATRTTPQAVMRASGRGLTVNRERFGLRRVLVVTQIALSLVLLVGALLFTRSLGNLLAVDAGFQQDGIMITTVGFRRLNLPVERRQPFRSELVERLRTIPGIDSAAEAAIVPLSGSGWGNSAWVDGADSRQQKDSSFNRVSPDYFKTLGTPLLAGRDFNNGDTVSSVKVAIVNESFARQLGMGANPVGRRFWVEATPNTPEILYEIVGLVKDTKYYELREDFAPIGYFPTSQDSSPGETSRILIRSNLPITELASSIKRMMAEINPEIDLTFQVFKTQIRDSLLRERLMALLSGFFGFLAALLATIGLYGVISFMVARRTQEIGIRMALGADRRQIVTMIMREAAILLSFGLVAGALLSLVVAKTARTLLFGLQPHDPVTFLLAGVLLAAVAAMASYLPARRAAKLDPVVALRNE